jgi:acetylglutamate kinase
MREETPSLFWRSRRGNPVNPFYFEESDGCVKLRDWKVFWYGIDAFADIAHCVAHARDRTPTLGD